VLSSILEEGGMSTSASASHREFAGIHNDHLFLAHLLDNFETSLNRLSREPGANSQQAEIETLIRLTQLLSDEMPHHCRREEDSLFTTVSAVSEELAEFCVEMKREHRESLKLLADFREDLALLDPKMNLAETLPQLIERGLELSCGLRAHVSREESELSGFL
jgi:hemerythrin-like domain-containing protein